MKVGYASIKIGKYGRKCAAYINDFDEDTVDVSWPGQHWGSYERDIVKVISDTGNSVDVILSVMEQT